MAKRDLFGECNVDGNPIDDFIRECCANCINPECTRSLSGKAKFDERTANWFERYFGDKNRMDPNDPRFHKIAGQHFIYVDPGTSGLTPEVNSAWLDPRDIPPPPAPAVVVAPPAAPVAQPAPPPRPVPQVQAQAAEPAPPPAPPPTSVQRAVPQQLLLANVPPVGGIMIPRPPGASSAPTPPRDPWAVPSSDPSDPAPIVAPGARVKMGGGV